MAKLRMKATRKKKQSLGGKARGPMKSAKKKASSSESTKAVASKNRKAQWSVYNDLQKKAKKAWTKLRADVKRKAPPETLVQDRDDLLLLLGECNYLASECMRMESMRRR